MHHADVCKNNDIWMDGRFVWEDSNTAQEKENLLPSLETGKPFFVCNVYLHQVVFAFKGRTKSSDGSRQDRRKSKDWGYGAPEKNSRCYQRSDRCIG